MLPQVRNGFVKVGINIFEIFSLPFLVGSLESVARGIRQLFTESDEVTMASPVICPVPEVDYLGASCNPQTPGRQVLDYGLFDESCECYSLTTPNYPNNYDNAPNQETYECEYLFFVSNFLFILIFSFPQWTVHLCVFFPTWFHVWLRIVYYPYKEGDSMKQMYQGHKLFY